MRDTRRSLLSVGSHTRGAAAVEFAIVSGVLILLLVGILEIGRALYAQNQIAFLADQAVRRVLVDPDISAAALESALRDQFTAGDPQSLAIAVSAESTGGASYRVVRIELPFTLFVPSIASEGFTLGVSRRVPAG
jgi:Flp pilus assembly protein TadG